MPLWMPKVPDPSIRAQIHRLRFDPPPVRGRKPSDFIYPLGRVLPVSFGGFSFEVHQALREEAGFHV